jgi:hypothetical protein
MSKLYAITVKGYNHPQSFGSAGKSAWTSAKWVDYHLSRGWRSRDLSRYDVHTIDLAAGTVTRCSATAFLASLPKNVEKSRGEIQSQLGLPLDLATLDALYRKGAFNDSYGEAVKAFLVSKGIGA